MKKSLSLLLAIALVFGLFASMASAADLSVEDKYQEFINKGILKGTTTGDAQLDSKLTRAQFATIAAAIEGLAPATVGETFSDVKKGQWWYGAIEAAAKAGLVNGTGAGKFSPRADVTVESVIKVAVILADKKPVDGAVVTGASAWAGPYVQAALDEKLISARTDYKAAATRGQTIDIAYNAWAATQVPPAPAKVSVVSAKATGVKKAEVTLDKAVDTSKATFTLKKGSLNVALDTVTWSEDKKTATLPLKDVKISEGTYTVTLAGLDAATVDKTTAEFTAENETVKKIEFVTASDEIVYNSKAKVKLRAENQYGELASFSASSYTVNAATLSPTLKKDSEGYLIVTLDTTVTGMQQGISMIPIYVYFDDNRVTAQKTFKLGTTPFVTKLELGEVKYNDGKAALTKAGESASVVLNLFDQYGNPVTPEQGVTVNINSIISPYTDALTTSTETSDDTYKVKVSVVAGKNIEKAMDYNLTVFAGSASQSKTIKVESSKVAMTVKIGQVEGVLAAGDMNKYIPLEVLDANGNALTPAEIAENADRITLSANLVTLGSGSKVVKVGKNKGKIHILSVPATAGKAVAFISASIMTQNANSYDNAQIKIADKRKPESVVLDTAPAAKAVLGATSDLKFVVKDQYGATLSTFTTAAGDKTYTADVTLTRAPGVTTDVYGKDTNTVVLNTGDLEHTYASTAFGQMDDGFTFDTAEGETGTARVTVALKADGTVISTTSASIESIANTANLTYSLKSLGDIYAAIDSELLTAGQSVIESSKVSKQVIVEVKDAAGNKVAFPGNRIDDITVSSSNVLHTAMGTSTNVGKAFVMGNKAGTATVTAIVRAADGTTKALSTTANAKSDLITVASITSETEAPMSGTTANVYTLMGLTVTDQYGVEYEGTEAYAYDNLLGVRFIISDIVGTGSVTYNHSTQNITVSGSVDGFVVTAVSRDGQVTAVTPVVVTP